MSSLEIEEKQNFLRMVRRGMEMRYWTDSICYMDGENIRQHVWAFKMSMTLQCIDVHGSA